MQVGDVVLKRSIYGGNVRWVFPHRYVGDWDGRLGLYCAPGSQGKWMGRDPEGYLERWKRGDPPRSRTWQDTHVLRFERPGATHNVEVMWDEQWELVGWYVNLQSPVVVHGNVVDTTDWALDIVVEPDGAWRWKDEDELEEAVRLGIFDAAGAAEVRAAGMRALVEEAWPTGWESWRPPADWGALGLPRDWHVV